MDGVYTFRIPIVQSICFLLPLWLHNHTINVRNSPRERISRNDHHISDRRRVAVVVLLLLYWCYCDCWHSSHWFVRALVFIFLMCDLNYPKELDLIWSHSNPSEILFNLIVMLPSHTFTMQRISLGKCDVIFDRTQNPSKRRKTKFANVIWI